MAISSKNGKVMISSSFFFLYYLPNIIIPFFVSLDGICLIYTYIVSYAHHSSSFPCLSHDVDDSHPFVLRFLFFFLAVVSFFVVVSFRLVSSLLCVCSFSLCVLSFLFFLLVSFLFFSRLLPCGFAHSLVSSAILWTSFLSTSNIIFLSCSGCCLYISSFSF